MTAEIGMLNKYAVALAADSAVTTTANGQRKVYNSANKVFMLSEKAPIGIMIYGSAAFMEIPWETIIKLFRTQLSNIVYPTLKEYAESFLSYISNELLIEEDAKLNFIKLKQLDLAYEILDYSKANQLTIADTIAELKDVLLNNYNILENFSHLETLVPTNLNEELLNSIYNIFEESNNQIEQKYDTELIELLDIYIRSDYFVNESGVVIAGFGEIEYFPQLVSYHIEGKIEDTTKYILKNDIQISTNNKASIVPFAQTDMVNTFIKGANPKLMGHFKNTLDSSLHKMLDEISQIISEATNIDTVALNDVLKETGNDFLYNQFQHLDNYQNINHIIPIIDTVKMLNKDELAEMAESLVNITSIEKKMSMNIETVGGPIDVAIISKGDGFVWYKRKHYFKPELNPHFFKNRRI